MPFEIHALRNGDPSDWRNLMVRLPIYYSYAFILHTHTVFVNAREKIATVSDLIIKGGTSFSLRIVIEKMVYIFVVIFI